MRRARSKLAIAAARRFYWLPLAAALVGCGYPAVEPVNLEIITSLRTACSARNDAWLAANEQKIENRRAAGRMNDAEYEAFTSIIRQAREGDWSAAERACLKFQKAQRASDEQIAKIRAFHES
jgi:hypothetical protein